MSLNGKCMTLRAYLTHSKTALNVQYTYGYLLKTIIHVLYSKMMNEYHLIEHH